MSTRSNTSNSRMRQRLIVLGIFLAIFAVAVSFALRGRNTVTGTYPASTKTGSSICTKTKTTYPYTDDTNRIKNNGDLRIVALFDESKQVKKIALDYTVYYSDNETATRNEPAMSTSFGVRLNEDNLPHDLFKNKFSIVDKKVILSLVAYMEEVTGKNYKYILLDSNPSSGLFLYEFEKTFKNKGFECIATGE
ncbi:hypothetical protein IKG06_00025 [Candidatus Saccharibacteria bacterium]|nr:hypothetical protein [Candidatus Saccharibacteria bacterium]